jgi:protease-4
MKSAVLRPEGSMRPKTNGFCLALLLVLAAGCSINLDVLGKPDMREVVLVRNPAKEKVLVIDVAGTIGAIGPSSPFSREGDVLSQVYSRLRRAADDALVRGVILKLDTPGGDVTSSDILYREILKFKEKTRRPVVGLMMGVAASGGYYVASACDAVVAHASTVTGSIGVIAVFPSVAGLFSKVGVDVRVVKSGALKDAGSPFRSMSAEEQKVFEGMINEMYEGFLKVVYERRKGALSMEELRRLADGRVYTGLQALRLKLVDEVGYFDDALARTLSLAGLRAARVVAYTYYPKRQNNLYAVDLKSPGLSDKKGLEDALPQLKAGFYYLWVPDAKTE